MAHLRRRFSGFVWFCVGEAKKARVSVVLEAVILKPVDLREARNVFIMNANRMLCAFGIFRVGDKKDLCHSDAGAIRSSLVQKPEPSCPIDVALLLRRNDKNAILQNVKQPH
jgi:hypothetical protein